MGDYLNKILKEKIGYWAKHILLAKNRDSLEALAEDMENWFLNFDSFFPYQLDESEPDLDRPDDNSGVFFISEN